MFKSFFLWQFMVENGRKNNQRTPYMRTYINHIIIATGCTDGTNDACCTENNLCGIGDGDCDSDAECQGDLICGSDNCDTSLGFDNDWDCCYDPIADLWNAN